MLVCVFVYHISILTDNSIINILTENEGKEWN